MQTAPRPTEERLEAVVPSPLPVRSVAVRRAALSRDPASALTQPRSRAERRALERSSTAVARRRRRRARAASGAPLARSVVRSLPYAGIAGVLALATIAFPIADGVAGETRAAVPAGASASPAAKEQPPETVPLETVMSLPRTVTDFSAVPEEQPVTAEVPATLVAPEAPLVTRVSRDGERPVLPGCEGVPSALAGANGQLDRGDLCELFVPGEYLRSDAAVALARLNVAYRARFGEDLSVTDSYRTLAEQEALRARKPGLAARPGTSDHGWGLAVDLGGGVQEGGSEQHRWLRENAPRYGWDNPEWARRGGGGPYEPWHWEYAAGM